MKNVNRITNAINFLSTTTKYSKYISSQKINNTSIDLKMSDDEESVLLGHLGFLYFSSISDEILEKILNSGNYSKQILKQSLERKNIQILKKIANPKLSEADKILAVVVGITSDRTNEFEAIARGMLIYLVQQYNLLGALLISGYMFKQYGYTHSTKEFEEFLFLHQNFNGSFGILNPFIPNNNETQSILFWKEHVTFFSVCFLQNIRESSSFFYKNEDDE